MFNVVWLLMRTFIRLLLSFEPDFRMAECSGRALELRLL